MASRRFQQVDVFTETPTLGNPVAVVVDADGLTDVEMQRFAAWTNLSETTFVLPPTDPGADYRVRIFCPGLELPFAGHPTLGTCHAWLASGGKPRDPHVVVQECGIGDVRIRSGDHLAFEAPPMTRSEPDPATLVAILAALGLAADDVEAAQVLDNGIAWWTILARDAATVLAVEPDVEAMRGLPDIGVAGLHPSGAAAVEVRAFAPDAGVLEDPVTGSLQASVGQWLIGTGVLPKRYLAAQGVRLGRAGRVHVEELDGQVWIGGRTHTLIEGAVEL